MICCENFENMWFTYMYDIAILFIYKGRYDLISKNNGWPVQGLFPELIYICNAEILLKGTDMAVRCTCVFVTEATWIKSDKGNSGDNIFFLILLWLWSCIYNYCLTIMTFSQEINTNSLGTNGCTASWWYFLMQWGKI